MGRAVRTRRTKEETEQLIVDYVERCDAENRRCTARVVSHGVNIRPSGYLYKVLYRLWRELRISCDWEVRNGVEIALFTKYKEREKIAVVPVGREEPYKVKVGSDDIPF